MSEIFKVAPWYNTEEWNDVYNNIFDVTSTLDNKQYALEQLLIWKARCPYLPSGIESTVSLLYVYIQDQGEISSDHLLRLAYSSALMRFVNHMLDQQTAKGISLYRAAKILGVPEWIIELRHDTAHSNNLPKLELLREASTISLKWLQKNYWDNHKSCISDYTVGQVCNETEIEKRITALMNFCVSLSICSHPKCNIKHLLEIKDVNLREYLIDDAKELLEDNLDFSDLKSISIGILRDAINSRAKKILSYDFSSSHVNKTLLSQESAFISLELLKHLDYNSYCSNKGLNDNYEQCFDGLLKFLFTHDLLQNFLLDLIKITQCEKEHDIKKCKLAAKWVSVILKNLYKNLKFQEKVNEADIDILSKDKKELKNIYYHWYPNEKDKRLLFDLRKPIPEGFTKINYIQPIISTYNSYLVFFIKDLLNLVTPRLPDPVIAKICQLAKVIASPEKFPIKSTKIYTADDLEITNDLDVQEINHHHEIENIEVDVEEEKNDPENEIQERFGIWKLASENHAWSTCPIGQLPWLTMEPMKT